MAATTRSRMDLLTFGSLLSTRDMVFVDVPTARATSLMVARVMGVWPGSMVPVSMLMFLRVVRLLPDDNLHAAGRGIPSTDFDHRCRRSVRGVARGEGERFTGPQRDVVVAPQYRQGEFAVGGVL